MIINVGCSSRLGETQAASPGRWPSIPQRYHAGDIEHSAGKRSTDIGSPAPQTRGEGGEDGSLRGLIHSTGTPTIDQNTASAITRVPNSRAFLALPDCESGSATTSRSRPLLMFFFTISPAC